MIWRIGNPYANMKKQLIRLISSGLYEDFQFAKFYPKQGNVRVSGVHPFAVAKYNQEIGQPVNVFPSVSVGISNVYENAPTISLDFEEGDFTQELLEKYRLVDNQLTHTTKFDEMLKAINAGQTLRIYTIRKRFGENAIIDIWTDNDEVKDFIFFAVRGLLQVYHDYFVGLGIENMTIEGRQDGDFNMDFGMLLYGSQIFFNYVNALETFLIVDENEPTDDGTIKDFFLTRDINDVEINQDIHIIGE